MRLLGRLRRFLSRHRDRRDHDWVWAHGYGTGEEAFNREYRLGPIPDEEEGSP